MNNLHLITGRLAFKTFWFRTCSEIKRDIAILEYVLTKHRAEVENMFLTKFDKKMYEEALREEGREELAEENEKLKIKLDEAETRANKTAIENERLRKELMQLKGQKE